MTTPPQAGPPGAPGAKKPGKFMAWVKKNPALAAGGAAGAGLLGFLLLRRNAQNAPGDLATPPDQAATAADGSTGAPGIFGDGSGSDPFGTLDAQLQALTGQLAASTAANNPPPGQSQFSIYAQAKKILQETGNRNPSQKQIFRERDRIINQLRPPTRRPRKHPIRMHPG